MDETTNILNNPHQSSRKTLYLVLVFILVVIIVLLTYLKSVEIGPQRNLAEEQILKDIQAEPIFTLSDAEEERMRQDIVRNSKSELSEEEKELIIKSLQE